jgi:hypothetical protein
MKTGLQRLFATALALVLVLSTVPEIPAQAASDVVPGKVVLASISSPGYHQITIKWKRASNATHYLIYYKKEGAKKWTKLAAVKSNVLSYRHVNSTQFPIVIGQKYVYTVRAYNSKSKRHGDYDRKGLPIINYPDPVTLKSAVWNADRTAVTVSWNKTRGGDYYLDLPQVDLCAQMEGHCLCSFQFALLCRYKGSQYREEYLHGSRL